MQSLVLKRFLLHLFRKKKKRQNSMVVTIELKASVTSTPEGAFLMDD